MRGLGIKNNQQGFISIIVTLIIMAILTLIVIGFASLMRREQKQALDRQLSTAAFYAAESGVNDAIDSLINDPDQAEISTCGNPPLNGYNNILETNGDVMYTCVLTDSTPDSLEKGNVSDKESTVLPVDTNGQAIGSIQISWQSNDPAFLGQFSSTVAFPQAAQVPGMINTGILRATTIPYSEPVTRGNLKADARTFFLFPEAGSGNPVSASYGASSSQGQVVSGQCQANDTPKECNVIINITGSPSVVWMRLKAIYRPVSASVRAYSGADGGGTQLQLYNAQRLIDSTGKANDVLRRIQVRKPLETGYKYPEFALESLDDICKRMAVWPGGADIDTSGIAGVHPACDLN